MIKPKNINWTEDISSYTGLRSFHASINNYDFLTITEIETGKYYIHARSRMFIVKGNNGIEKWGYFDDIDKCKNKSEEIIKEAVMSLIDLRSHNIDELI